MHGLHSETTILMLHLYVNTCRPPAFHLHSCPLYNRQSQPPTLHPMTTQFSATLMIWHTHNNNQTITMPVSFHKLYLLILPQNQSLESLSLEGKYCSGISDIRHQLTSTYTLSHLGTIANIYFIVKIFLYVALLHVHVSHQQCWCSHHKANV